MTRAPLPDDLRRRATASRDLLRGARRSLDAGGPFAAGHAVLQMRDAAAMLLRVAADHLGVGPGEEPEGERGAEQGEDVVGGGDLTALAEGVDGAAPARLTHRPALDRVATAAAAFLATGDVPDDEDARGLLHDLESFFTETVRGVLESDPGRLDLRHLVGHRRSENWLAKAGEALREEAPAEAIRAAAAALAIFRWHLDGGQGGSGQGGGEEGADGELADLRRRIDRQRADLDLLLAGADLSGYRRYRRLAPTVEVAGDGSLQFPDDSAGYGPATADPTLGDATFCHDFVLETLLTLRQGQAPGAAARDGRTNVVLRVVRAVPILVTPGDGGEEIRRVSSGEVLKTHRTGEPKDGHLPIVVDGDPAWVAADAVEEIG